VSARDKHDLPAATDEVSAAYRAARFDETPSPQVDAQILAAAARGNSRLTWQLRRPFALAATVVLALGIVLRLAFPGAGLEESPDAAGLRSSPAAVESSLPLQLQDSAGGAAAESLAVPAAAARSAQPAEAVLEGEVAACTPMQRGEPERWLACISLQLDRASVDRARAEYTAFSRAYPDYPVPEQIAARIER
jgi:hypothetical protein